MLKSWLSIFSFFLLLSLSTIRPAVAVMIINGQETDAYPSVVQLFQDEDHHCTAVWITEFVLLTADHCVHGPSDDAASEAFERADVIIPRGLVFRYKGEDIKVERAYRPQIRRDWYRPEVRSLKWTRAEGANDVAVLTFSRELKEIPDLMPLSKTPAKPGESVTLVGFGYNQYELGEPGSGRGIGFKRSGFNSVSAVAGGVIELQGEASNLTDPETGASATGQNVMIAPGDSGSPLVRGGEIVGIASNVDRTRLPLNLVPGMGPVEARDGALTSRYVDLQADETQAFLSEVLPQLEADLTSQRLRY